MRWIALALLAGLAAAIWWFGDPWPTRSVQWDTRYADAANRAACNEQVALIRVGIEADYPPAAAALGELAERNACGYRAGQFDYEDEDYAGRAVQRNWIEQLLSSYTQSTESHHRYLNNGWFLRGQVIGWFAAASGRPGESPHEVLRSVARRCADHLLDSSYATHWVALEDSMQDEDADPHATANAIYQQQLACREIIYQASVNLRAATSWSLRERGRSLQTEALYLGHPQAIAECMDFVLPSDSDYDDPHFEQPLYCPFDEGQQLRDWTGRGDGGARARWLASVDTDLWADGSYSSYNAASPLWVAIHATIAGHPIRNAALDYLSADCMNLVDEIAVRVQQSQDAPSPSSGPVIDEIIRDAWRCEPEAIRDSLPFENYYPNEAFSPYHERWTSIFDPAHPDFADPH